MRYTEEGTEEANHIKSCQGFVERLLLATNRAIKEEEDHSTLQELSDTIHFPGSDMALDLTQPSRLMGNRRIIRQGELAKGRRRKPVQAWLFNDHFLLLKEDGAAMAHDVSLLSTRIQGKTF